jgi:phosphoribosylcarboxyaminoimidazole (NCAIR) mutase
VSEPLVGIAIGSSSDLPTLQPAADILVHFGAAHEIRVLSAHLPSDGMATNTRSGSSRHIRL